MATDNRACCNKTRGNAFIVIEGRFILDIRKKFFTMRMVKHLDRLPREVVDTCLGLVLADNRVTWLLYRPSPHWSGEDNGKKKAKTHGSG